MECSISKETLRNKFVTLKGKLYYIDRSVLLENTPLIKFRDPSGVFSLSSPVRIWKRWKVFLASEEDLRKLKKFLPPSCKNLR